MARIQERKRKDGKISFTVTIRLKGFPIQTATFARKTDAQKWIQDTESAIRDGRYFKASESRKHTLKELINRYLENELKNRKTDHQKITMHLNWWSNNIGAYFLSDITPALLSEYKEKLQKEPYKKFKRTSNKTKKCEEKQGEIERFRSNATINRYMASLSIVLSIATKEWGWLEENPMIKVKKKKESRGRVRSLSDKESEALLKACEKATNPHLYPVVLIALTTGARMSEILNLKWENVELKRKLLYFLDTKNGESRSAHIVIPVLEILKERSKVRDLKTNYVFPRFDGKKPIDLRHQWETVIKESGIENFRFHDLRHTAASYLAMNGATLIELSHILGHKTLQMVKRYAHLTEKHTAPLVEKMTENQFLNVKTN